MKISDALHQNDLSPLDTELLLAHVCKKDRTWLLAHSDTPLSTAQISDFNALVNRRKNHEPISYITNEKEFYGRSFYVDNRVLIPRPATETLIDEVKFLFENEFKIDTPRTMQADTDIVITTRLFPDRIRSLASSASSDSITIIDIGTGSGNIAITLALELPDVKIIATDTSKDALQVAKQNSTTHKVSSRINFNHVTPNIPIFEYSNTLPYLIVSNPPYISEDEKLMSDVCDYEPRQALFGGSDGMQLLTFITDHVLNDNLCIGCVLECQLPQAKKLSEHFLKCGNPC